MSDHVQRCRLMLTEQIEQLRTLANASARDPGFKLWRQNTLTVLQRVWPGDSTRSERFRRIAFTPAPGKPDGEMVRESFALGCTDTTAYLNALIEMIDREGVPPAPEVAREALPTAVGTREDDFPVLELPAAGAPASASRVLDQSDSLADMASMPGTDAGRDAGAPAPPQFKGKLTAPPINSADAPQSLSMQRSAALKVEHSPGMAHVAPPAAPEAPVVSAAPEATAAPVSPEAPAAPVAEVGAMVIKRTARPAKGRRPAPKGRLKDMLGLGSLVAPSMPESEPAPELVLELTPVPAPEPAVEAPLESELPLVDAAAAEQATQDFMRSSPVLGLQGKPVQRTSDDTGFSDPDAIAVATLAGDVGRHGVPEDARAALRVTLLELAHQLEEKSLPWASLHIAVTSAMEYPDVARRLMPVVLPWMERAA